MLGARLQRPPILNLQQPSPPPARKVGPVFEGVLPRLWRRIHSNNSTERAPASPKVQDEEARIDEQQLRVRPKHKKTQKQIKMEVRAKDDDLGLLWEPRYQGRAKTVLSTLQPPIALLGMLSPPVL